MEDEANIIIFITFVVEFALKCVLNHKNPINIDEFLPKSICLVPVHAFLWYFNIPLRGSLSKSRSSQGMTSRAAWMSWWIGRMTELSLS